MHCLYNSTYSDYVHVGADLGMVLDNLNLGEGDLGKITIHDHASTAGIIVQFDQEGICALTDMDGTAIDNGDAVVQFAYGFGPSAMYPHPHVRAEMFIDRDVFGDFGYPDIPAESFFDVFFEVQIGGGMGPSGDLGEITMNGQRVTLDPTLDPFPVPDTDGDGIPYEDPFAIGPSPIEEETRASGIASIPRIPGDATNDGIVDEEDAAQLASHWGEGDATWAMGDFDNDHFVGPSDAALLTANWHYGIAEETPAVPEPSAVALSLVAALGLLLQRRR